MTDKTQPEALRLALSIDLMDTFTDYQQEELNKAAAELRRQHARIAELEAELEAVGAGGVQALSAAQAVLHEPTNEMYRAAQKIALPYDDDGGTIILNTSQIRALWHAMLAASPTPPAEQQAQPGAVGRTGCTAGTDEECTRRGCATSCPAQQAAPKAAPGEPDPADIIAGALQISRGHAIEMMREALEAAPQKEAQEPALFVSPKQLAALTDPDDPEGEHGRYLPARKTSKGLFTQPLYTAPQPAPAPLSERTDAEIVAQTVELTKYLMSWKWGLEPECDASRIWESKNTKAQVCWNAACHIQDLLTQTDVWNAVTEVDGATIAAQGGKV